ncbi:MAG: septum formation initiator family protein [Patescibacteria group bacterium]
MRTRSQSWSQRLWNARTLAVLGALSVFAVGSGLISLSLRNRSIDADLARLDVESRSLETRNVELVELLKRFETSGFLEREARLKLNLQKPGETVVVVERTATVTSSTARVAPIRTRSSNAERWWLYFFDPETLSTST